MYNSENDPLIKYYDFTLATCNQAEIDYYRSKAENCPLPIIDLCCGTGIIALEIAKLGKRVYAIDQSGYMLDKFRDKLSDTAGNISLILARMDDFQIEDACGLCICRDAFFHNLTPDSQRKTLRNIRNSLVDNGELCFNIHYPSHKYLSWLDTDEAKQFKERAVYPIPGDRNRIRVSQAAFVNYKEQVVETKLKYETLNEHDTCIKEEYSGWISRYTYPYEMFHLLELEGFRVNNVYGNYKREEYNTHTMLIIEATKSV